jgi:hypothetical protein
LGCDTCLWKSARQGAELRRAGLTTDESSLYSHVYSAYLSFRGRRWRDENTTSCLSQATFIIATAIHDVDRHNADRIFLERLIARFPGPKSARHLRHLVRYRAHTLSKELSTPDLCRAGNSSPFHPFLRTARQQSRSGRALLRAGASAGCLPPFYWSRRETFAELFPHRAPHSPMLFQRKLGELNSSVLRTKHFRL